MSGCCARVSPINERIYPVQIEAEFLAEDRIDFLVSRIDEIVSLGKKGVLQII